MHSAIDHLPVVMHCGLPWFHVGRVAPPAAADAAVQLPVAVDALAPVVVGERLHGGGLQDGLPAGREMEYC